MRADKRRRSLSVLKAGSPKGACVLSISVMLQEGKRQCRDQCSVSAAHARDPLPIRAQLDGAGLEAVGVARDGVAHADPDLALARQGELCGHAHEAEDAREALAGLGDEVLVAQTQVSI